MGLPTTQKWVAMAYAVAVGTALLVAQATAQTKVQATPPVAGQQLYTSDMAVLDADSLRMPSASYVGADVCRSCHVEAWNVWLGTAHARSWVFLRTAAADSIAARIAGGPVREPAQSQRCLTCHGTAADVVPVFRTTGLALQDGVQCEACHGPGSMHVEPGLILGGDKLEASRMEIPDEQGCRVCHKADRPSHEWMGRPAFDFVRAQARIAYPTSRQARLDLLREQPGGFLSITLRTLLGHLFGS
ncbi:MAG: cytochrome c family protein [bacterium]|nr:cytochrome c family protein [bacterium]